jgi:two-component system, OmpR family, response regulator
MTQAVHILVVEDDTATRALLVAHIRQGGFRVSEAPDGNDALAILNAEDVDVVILDLNLPDRNGLFIAHEVVARWDTNIIMVTERGAPEERARGLEIGADDYIAKPVYPRELMLRLQNVLEKRTGKRMRGQGSKLSFGNWTVDLKNRTIAAESGSGPELTQAEFDLLCVLLTRAGRLQNRDQLMSALGSADAESGPRSVDILISRLRRKLGDGDGARLIETCRGHGYRFIARVTRV